MLLYGALSGTNPVVDGIHLSALSLDNFTTVLANENVHAALLNTLIACTGGTAIAVAIGLAFAWIVVRTNTPWNGLIAISGLLPLFVPPLVAGIAWTILGSPRTGLINTMFAGMGLDWRVNFYSMPGLIAVFGMYYAPYVYMFTAAALRNMDPALEEAAEIAGANPLRTLLTVTFPLIMPAIISGMLLSFIIMLGIYGIPAVLGTPANIAVLTTYIFNLTAVVAAALQHRRRRGDHPDDRHRPAGRAAAERALRAQFHHRRRQGVPPAQAQSRQWRFATLGFALVYLFIVVVLPSAALLIAAFRKFLFIRGIAGLIDTRQYGLQHFEHLFANPLTLRSIVNTMEVGLVTALLGGSSPSPSATPSTARRCRGRKAVELIATLPVAIPGLVVGVAYLWAWVGLPGGLYGTIWIRRSPSSRASSRTRCGRCRPR